MAYHCSQTEIPRLIHAQLRPDLQPYSVCCSLPTHPSIQQWEPHMFLQKLASIHLLFPLHSVFFSSPYYNHLVHSVHLKKCTTWELWVKFYLKQIEDNSLGNSISDSSETMRQRSTKEVSIYVILVKRKYMYQAHIFFAEGFCWSWGADITMKDFCVFLVMRRYKNWAHTIGSWKYLRIWRAVLPVFLKPQSALFLLSTLNSSQGVLIIDSCR